MSISVRGTKWTTSDVRYLVANGGRPDMAPVLADF